MIAQVALVHRELEWPKYWSHGLSLIANGSRGLRSLSSNFKKFLPLHSDAWKDILYWARMELQSHFLQKSQDDLHEKFGVESKLLVLLSTSKYSDYLSLLGQSQNSMQLLLFFIKNALSSWEIVAEWIW